MRRPELFFLAPLVGIGGWIAVQARDVRAAAANQPSLSASLATAPIPRAVSSHAAHTASAPRSAFAAVAPSGFADGGVAGADVRTSREPPPVRDLGEIRRRLIENQSGTYIGDILAERDSNIARWPDRLSSRPLRVWIQSADKLTDWNPVYVAQVRDAFTTWVGAGVPVPFTFVNDSSQGDVHVTWVDHFDEQISGKTMWARDDNWWIVDANITIALHHNHGEPLDASAVRAIALHEVGHLLGLDHCADTTNIMTPRVRVRDLSESDKATMRLIYALPPGSVKEAMAGG